MTTLSSALTASTSDPGKLGELLNYGQMGLALAFLLIGSGLFTTALLKDRLNDTFASVLKLFGTIMLILFVTSFIGEMVVRYMDFDLKRHPPDRLVRATISLPPLNSTNYKQYGPIEILYVPEIGTKKPFPGDQPQTVEILNGGNFYIDLESLTTKVKSLENLQSATHAELEKALVELEKAGKSHPGEVVKSQTTDPAQ